MKLDPVGETVDDPYTFVLDSDATMLEVEFPDIHLVLILKRKNLKLAKA